MTQNYRYLHQRTQIYRCTEHNDVNNIQKYYQKLGYTFNCENRLMVVSKETTDEVVILLHINHTEKNMSYDYYRPNDTNKIEHLTERLRNCIVEETKYFWREHKLKRILSDDEVD